MCASLRPSKCEAWVGWECWARVGLLVPSPVAVVWGAYRPVNAIELAFDGIDELAVLRLVGVRDGHGECLRSVDAHGGLLPQTGEGEERVRAVARGESCRLMGCGGLKRRARDEATNGVGSTADATDCSR